MSELNNETYYGKISNYRKVLNKLDIREVKEAIEIVQAQFDKEMRDPSKTHLKSEKLDIPYAKLKKQPIEYVSEEENEEDIQEKASGEER